MTAADLLAFGFVGVVLGWLASLRIAAMWRAVARSESAERGRLEADLSRSERVMRYWRDATLKAEAERDALRADCAAERERCARIVEGFENTDPDRAIAAAAAQIRSGR